MTNENYKRCRTCRFCIHSEDIWVCSLNSAPTDYNGTCERYRPGSCENCNSVRMSAEGTLCAVTGEETHILSVCSDYDPSGRRSV